jgi:20S proteasome alpha/beta subunit
MACDSRGSCGPSISPVKAQKHFLVGKHTLVAAVGDAIIPQECGIMCHGKEDTVDALIEMTTYMSGSPYDGCLLLVNEDGELTSIDGNGATGEIEDYDWWAIGSASEYVIGYLMAIQGAKGEVTPLDAKEAIRVASKFCADIDDRVQIHILPTEDE